MTSLHKLFLVALVLLCLKSVTIESKDQAVDSPRQSIIVDTDPGIDDALLLMYLFLNPNVHVRAVTLTHGNTSLDHVKRNADTCLRVIRKHRESLNQHVPRDELPVLAVGSAMPLNAKNAFESDFHGADGLGNIYSKNPYWDSLLEENAEAYRPTERDAADEILHQLREAPALTIPILAVGPQTNIAIAYQRDPVTFSRAKCVVIMGGNVDTPGNDTPMAEFNFRGDPDAADLVLSSSKGFKHSPEGLEARHELIKQNKQAPMHIVILPLTKEGVITEKEYKDWIVPTKTPVGEFCNAFLLWIFEACPKLQKTCTLQPYDALAGLLLTDLIGDKGDGLNTLVPDFAKYWETSYLDLRVETTGKYTLGMACYDKRGYELDGKSTPWGDDQANNVQVVVRGNGPRFTRIFLNTVFSASVV